LPWLKAVGAEDSVAFTAQPTESNSSLRQASGLLLGLRLFQSAGVVDNDGRMLVVRMHRLVQELVAKREGFAQEQLLARVVAYAEARCKAVATGWLDWMNRWELEPLRAFADQLFALGHSHASYFANEVAVPLSHLARYAEAEALYRRVLAAEQKGDYPGGVFALINLSTLLQETNRLAEAEQLLRAALPIAERNGPDHPDVARVLNNFGQLLLDTDRLDDAESLMRHALAIDEQKLGPEHPTVAIDLNNLARVLNASYRVAEAEPLYRRALAIDERSLGPEHPNVAFRLNNLASVLLGLSRLAEAEVFYRRALAIREQILGREHPEVAVSLNGLAHLLQTANRASEAETLYRRALTIGEQSLGPDHPDVAGYLNNLAGLLQAADRLSEAEPFYRRALRILEQGLGARHSKVATTLNNLALLLRATSRAGEAQPLMKRAVAIWEQRLGQDHHALAHGLNNLAQLLQDTGNLAEAEQWLRRALAIRQRSLGSTHVLVAVSLNNLASLMEDTREFEEAESLYLKAVEILDLFRTNTGCEHRDHHLVLANLLRLRRRVANATVQSAVDAQDEESVMNVSRPTTGFGPDRCSRCGAPGFARDAGPSGRKRKGQLFVVTEGWFLKLVLFRCSDCDGVFCGGCCRLESRPFDDGKSMLECLCPSCGQVLGAYPAPHKRHAELVEEMRSRIDGTDMRTVKAYFRDPNSEIKQVILAQNGCPLEEVAAVMVSGSQETLMNMLADGWVKVGVDSMDRVPVRLQTSVILLDTFPDDQYCEIVYLPPAYVVRIITGRKYV
jgi:tetratricopeptide (TPR) repeat protein